MKFVILILLLSFSFVSNSSEKICVLGFERRAHPFSETLREIFDSNDRVLYIEEAIPLDILRCIKEKVSEITIVAHSFRLDSDLDEYRLGYFREIFGEKRKEKLEGYRRILSQTLAKLEDGKIEMSCESKEFDDHRRSNCSENKQETSRVRRSLEFLDDLDDDYPIYDSQLFFNKFFKKMGKILENQLKNEGKIVLRNIRLMGCTPKEVLKGHPELDRIIKKYSIGFESAPKQNLMSLLKGKDLTTMDARWLAQSVQFDNPGEEDDGFYVYINLKTFLLHRKGEAFALRGKYKITVEGVALGIASKWSTVFVKYSDVKDLEVGGTKEIVLPKLDLQAALWINGEIQLGREFEVLGTSEINSLGVSVGLIEKIHIKRIY